MIRDGKMSRAYSTRSNAIRAARKACRIVLDAPRYEAFEGPDFGIHPSPLGAFGQVYRFSLRGPALDAQEERTS